VSGSYVPAGDMVRIHFDPQHDGGVRRLGRAPIRAVLSWIVSQGTGYCGAFV
jgi:hypothetical protein